MADTATEHEADCGSSNIISETTQELRQSVSHDDADQTEERVTGSNINYDSSEGTHRCTKCDFEGSTATSLINHITISHMAAAATAATATANEVSTMEVSENNNPPADRVHRKMFECDVCNMRFSNGANMRRHKMRHTGVKPYECRVCQKRFFRKDHLAEHFTTHTKTLPYHCPICNRGFQRQIAMRAHFQNEHVGQNDIVKSCPLCNYRAGSMKNLRIHFFNRHGIDLDNPGPAGSPNQIMAAVAQQSFNPVEGALNSLNQLSTNLSVSVTSANANYSDSGDSTGARSTDNATPPMHFLTPHVEISMADAPNTVFSPSSGDQQRSNQNDASSQRLLNGDCPNSPQSADSNSNAPSSSHIQSSFLRLEQETSITPSISLIPIKQEPGEDYGDGTKRNGNSNINSSPSNSLQMNATSTSLSSLIKVSPLKSLLRDDKRKTNSRNNSRTRSGRTTSSPNANNSDSSPTDANTTTNGTITSTGPEQPSDSTLWRIVGKRSLQCIFCGIAFPDQTLYFLHKGCHSDSNPWKCNICGEQCCSVYEFNSHLLSKSHQ